MGDAFAALMSAVEREQAIRRSWLFTATCMNPPPQALIDAERATMEALTLARATECSGSWQHRDPTLAEVAAHEEVHGRVWGFEAEECAVAWDIDYVDERTRGGVWQWRSDDGCLPKTVFAIVEDGRVFWWDGENDVRDVVGMEWRPLTADIDPCDWPVPR